MFGLIGATGGRARYVRKRANKDNPMRAASHFCHDARAFFIIILPERPFDAACSAP